MSRRLAHILLSALAVVGLLDSAYLVHVKWSFRANPNYDGGMCGLGGGCDTLQRSAMAEVFGIPISLFGAAFYVAFLVLLVLRMRADDDAPRAPTLRRLHLAMALLGCVYSIVLLAYSLSVGQFCPFCGVLYGVNALLALVAWRSLGESLATFFKSAWRAALTPAAGVAFGVFVVVTGGGFAAFSATLPPPPEFKDPLADPSKPHRDFAVAGRASRGPESAPIHIVEFADFECPHCRGLFHTLEAVLATRGDSVHLTFLHFPLDNACNRAVPGEFHKRACELAAIAECARQQGKFFEAAAILFDEGPQTPKPALLDKVAALGADKGKLESCLADPATVESLKRDIEQGLAAGVRGTPAVYVNGYESGGARPREFFEDLIDRHTGGPAKR